MPVSLPPATILVTGASGFIASWVCLTLLRSGYSVRGTVRTTQEGEYLRKLFTTFGDNFQYVVVVDGSKVGAYDEAVQGDLSAIVHIAGPTTFTDEGMAEFKLRIVQGTTNLLESTRKHSRTVKRFIYMSSAQAMLGKPLGHIYTADDWNDGAVAATEKDLAACNGQVRYQAGKVLAERAVLDFPQTHGGPGVLGWDVVSLVPAWTFGPVIHQFNSLEDLNYSSSIFYHHMTQPQDKADVNNYGSDYVDVRDVAEAVVTSLRTAAAAGQRLILDAGAYTFQNLYDVLNEPPAVTGVPVGDPDAPKFSFPGPFCDSSKTISTLGLSFRPLKDTARDALASFRERGL